MTQLADLESKLDSLMTYASHQQAHVAELDALLAAGADASAIRAVADAMKAKGALLAGLI